MRVPVKKEDLVAKAEQYLSGLIKLQDDDRSRAIAEREENLSAISDALGVASKNIMSLYAGDDEDVEYSDYDDKTPLSILHYKAQRNRPGYVIVKLVVADVQFPSLPDYTDDVEAVKKDIDLLKATTKAELQVGEGDHWYRYFGTPQDLFERRNRR